MSKQKTLFYVDHLCIPYWSPVDCTLLMGGTSVIGIEGMHENHAIVTKDFYV